MNLNFHLNTVPLSLFVEDWADVLCSDLLWEEDENFIMKPYESKAFTLGIRN